MALFLLACLLAVFPVASMKSPVFGPQEVSSVEGNSVSIRCYYPPTSVNRHTRKYWCRQEAKGRCITHVSSNGYISKEFAGRVNLVNFPESGSFVVNISKLTPEDSGSYKCGLGISSRGLSFDVSLEVSQAPGLNDTHVYTEDLGKTVTIVCPFKRENIQNKKSLCKKTGQACELVIDSQENTGPGYKDRAQLVVQGTTQLAFQVVLSHLRLSDAGLYVCQAGEGSGANKKTVDLRVLAPEPELLYGDLRGSVTFDCAQGLEVAQGAQFLCRVSHGDTCDVVINSLGNRSEAFEGRVLLTPKDDHGPFSVLVTGLKKEDAGRYLCGVHPSGRPQEGLPVQAWDLFVNEETPLPPGRSVVKGVAGGSVALLCDYNPKESSSIKYWCRWEGAEHGRCPLLVESQGLVQEQYEGRLALHEEPGNGSYTVILNRLTPEDAGFYWCLTNGDHRWRTTVELQVVEGEPSLKVPEDVTAVVGQTVQLSCHYPCKFYSYEKYWCRWSNKGCQVLPSQDEGSSQASVSCDQNSRLVSLTLSSVTKADEGWYWCGVKQGSMYGETAAIYVAVEEGGQGSHGVSPARANSAPEEAVAEAEAGVREVSNRANLHPRLFAEEKAVEGPRDQGQVPGSQAAADASSSGEQGGGSRVLLSTLLPLGLVLALGAMAVWVARVRHRKNVDRLSIRSYRTDISLSDFENSRDFGARDNLGASPATQETILEGKAEVIAPADSTTDPEEPKKAKRSSKEEADMAYSAFLLQSSNIAAQVQDGPKEA